MRKTQLRFLFVLSALVLIDCLPSLAQVATGTPPFGSFGGGPDVINLGNLNAHLAIPVLNKAGRGMPFTYTLAYDSSVWSPVSASGVQAWTPTLNWGWLGQTAISSGYIAYKTSTAVCGMEVGNPKIGYHFDQTGANTTLSNFTYFDTFGIPHSFTGVVETEWTNDGTPCGSTQNTLVPLTTDGSGYTFQYSAGTITSRTGRVYLPPQIEGVGAASATDRNGNQISVSSSGVFTDTLGTSALTVTGSSPTTFTYTAPSGASASYTMNFTTYTVATNFGIAGITEYGATAIALVSSITLPDGTQYTFTYEPTPSTPAIGACTPKSGTYAANCVTARIASVQLPTGGTISYAYSGGNNGILSDGSTAGLTRTVNPGGQWTYVRSGSGSAWGTTITDPQNNQTAINFQEESTSHNFYETEREVYQGSTSGTLLQTKVTCYNGIVPNPICNSTAVSLPITQRTSVSYLPSGAGVGSRTDAFYNGSGLVTEKDEYGYGTTGSGYGSLARKTLTTYASLGNGIVSMPATVTVEDGSGSLKSQTTYTYDQGGVTSTSGTPQHVAVSGSRGNATTVSRLVQGSTTLSKTYTYYDTGTVNTATDVNGAVTTYTYGSGASCGNSFATSVSEPMSLSRSMAWNCTGGVQTSLTDENGHQAMTTYNDPYFWRANQVKDAAANVANLTYDAAISAEGAVVFGSSTTDALTTVDGLGRPHISQIKESPTSSTYDSVETDYDSDGRPSRTTLPYPANASTTNSTAPGTTTTYDALGRKLQVTDSAGKIVTYSYLQNDVYRTVSPAPAGENTKRKQFEYDALGRLTSVCEVTSVNGGGSCGQNTAATGYLTQYFYDALNDLISVVQNAQSANKQTRSYFYDGLGRLTSETNPESGTKNYYYDSDSTMCGNGVQTFHGDLVKTTDNAGNCIAMFYDALHRLTDVGNSNQSVSHCKRFRYDNSSGYPGSTKPSGLANTLGRLVEAATDQCVTGNDAIITDEWFSYTALGQPSTVYESTPHSGGYYGTGASYWPNGVPSSITGMVYSVNYNVDGEGRIYSTSNVAGQNLLTSTYYNYASQPTQVNFGSGDSDTFTYDSKSNRMTQYKFSVNGQSVTGTLTWNAIGTLGTLAVTDQFYGPGNQTCSYTHDDMSRIAGANCGSPWNQTFSYDAFGNISKSGTISFQPTYSYLTNHMTQIGSSTPNYDGNGNVLNDTAHTYTWDVYGKPITIDGVTLTYDALGRMVEQNRNGSYTEIDYAPTGAKLQILQGQQAITDFNRLPGGAVAVDLASAGGLAYYRHSDWLGSSRLASTPSRTIYYDGAYAPFGENYAQTGTTDLSFTGMNQDTVSNLFDFPAREYNAIHGRWPSPDPGGLSSVHSGDPQTLNRYAYVRNSPLGFTDSTGMDLDECDDTCGDPDGGGGGGGGGACDPTVDPTCGGDPGSCDPDVCGDDGNGQDDNNCDANCQQQIDQAELQAVNALNNSECALAVDGGTGRAAGTIKGSSSSLGTITTGDLGSGGVAASTQNLGGNQSQITLNTNPTLGFLNGPIPGYTPLASQAISLLHDLGHAAENAGVSTAVVDDSLGATGDLLASIDLSVQNSYTVGDACFPQGDGGQNQGPIDDGSTPVAAAKRTRRRF